jgi:hypothetical protein
MIETNTSGRRKVLSLRTSAIPGEALRFRGSGSEGFFHVIAGRTGKRRILRGRRNRPPEGGTINAAVGQAGSCSTPSKASVVPQGRLYGRIAIKVQRGITDADKGNFCRRVA